MINTSLFRVLPVLGAMLCLCTTQAQDTYPVDSNIDVTHYVFSIGLNDSTNVMQGKAEVTVHFTDHVAPFDLDLIGIHGEYGMEISSITEGTAPARYTFANNKIHLEPQQSASKTETFTITYHGVPERGLVISTTKYGQRSFFGDNWPNLARNWLPSVDHPHDKASVEFHVTAPQHYDVVATGKKWEESNLNNGYKLTVYKEPAPVATKVMTIGVTQFATKLLGEVHHIPVTAWVYPENRLEGFSDYAVARDVMEFFIDSIGPYSYAKLANMQAKTQWGGLENAGTIAYSENSVTGKNTVEGLMAHEIAHQWFGDSATEKTWNHVWLSESFATYFSILFQEHAHGDAKRKEELAIDRKQVMQYDRNHPGPIVDLTITDPMQVLNVHTYQKGGWVLNMLRHKLGSATFWKGIRAYYAQYRNSNVLTEDFRKVMEEVSGQNLKAFFQQWIFTGGHPVLQWNWEQQGNKMVLHLQQTQQGHVYQFPLEVGIVSKGKTSIQTVEVSKANETFELKVSGKPEQVVLDPNLWLLFEEKPQ